MRDAADRAAVEIAGKYCRTDDPGNRPVLDMIREAYMDGWQAGREDAGRGRSRVRSRDAVRPVASMRPRPTEEE